MTTRDTAWLSRAVLNVASLAAPGPEIAKDPDNYIARLPEWDAEPRRLTAIGGTVGKIVLGSMTGHGKTARTRDMVPEERVAQSVELFDTAGLLTSQFWIDCGIYAAGSTETPQFLPLLHAKLAGPSGEEILSQVRRPQIAARLFI